MKASQRITNYCNSICYCMPPIFLDTIYRGRYRGLPAIKLPTQIQRLKTNGNHALKHGCRFLYGDAILIHHRAIKFLTHGSHILVYGTILHLGVNLSCFDVGMTEHF